VVASAGERGRGCGPIREMPSTLILCERAVAVDGVEVVGPRGREKEECKASGKCGLRRLHDPARILKINLSPWTELRRASWAISVCESHFCFLL